MKHLIEAFKCMKLQSDFNDAFPSGPEYEIREHPPPKEDPEFAMEGEKVASPLSDTLSICKLFIDLQFAFPNLLRTKCITLITLNFNLLIQWLQKCVANKIIPHLQIPWH